MSERRRVLELFEQKGDELKEKIAQGIEKNRKGDAVISVVGKDGKALFDCEVKIRQKSHHFKFGANIFMLDELETEQKNEEYKKVFAETFNMATLPFYWNSVEPERNAQRYDKNSKRMYRRPPIDLCIEFCKEHGIEPREHALAYEAFFPLWLWGEKTEVVKKELERRFSEVAERYADIIPTIEVTNEMFWDKGHTDFYEDPDFVAWCFKLADKYFPNNQLVVNEFTGYAWGDRCKTNDKYLLYIQNAMLKGARIDAVGMQYHLFIPKDKEYETTRNLLNPDSLYAHMDLYAGLNIPLQVTEITLPAYSNEEEDEQIQADMLEWLYSIWFSHHNTEQIIYWNVVDGYTHVENKSKEQILSSMGDMTMGENVYYGGLLRFDMTKKPAYYRLYDLIHKRWHTELCEKTKPNGECNFRGFYGVYEVEVMGKKFEIDLSKGAENKFILKI